MSEIDIKENTHIKTKRRGNPKWHKGMSSPNPKGNTHARDISGLIVALNDKSKREGFANFDALVAERAMRYETVLIAVLKKIYPDQIEGKGFGDKIIIIHPPIKDKKEIDSGNLSQRISV